MTTDMAAIRSKLIDTIREAAEVATDGPTRVTVCADGVRLRAARHWMPPCVAPTEVEIDLTEELPTEVEADPEDLQWWIDKVATELVARVVRMLDDVCALEDEAARIAQRLREKRAQYLD